MMFLFYPMLKSVYLSMTITDPRGQVVEFVWLENFIRLLSTDSFYKNLGVTLMFILFTVPTSLIWSLFLAAITHNKSRGMKVFQFVFSLPIVISVGTGSIIWFLLFHPTAGMLNYFLSFVHLGPIPWLTDPSWALISISIMTIWMNMGFLFIVLSSGLQGVPEEIYESAKMDGSGPIRTFIQIVLPAAVTHDFLCFDCIGYRCISSLRTNSHSDQGWPDQLYQCHGLLHLSGCLRQFPVWHRRTGTDPVCDYSAPYSCAV